MSAIRKIKVKIPGQADQLFEIDAAVSNMTGAGANAGGTAGLVPAPAAGDQDKVLKGDGTWGTIQIPTVLPVVSSADDGKVLRVINGVWTADDVPDANGVDF